MLICEDCGEGYHVRCVGRKKKCPRASGAAMPVSNSKEHIIPGWAAGLWPFWGQGSCVVGGHCQNQPCVVCASKSS